MKNTKSTIPLKLREELKNDPEYGYCCVTGEVGTKDDPIEWHHNLKFAGSNVQERFCILPILHSIHVKADIREVREKLNWIMWNRATAAEIAFYSKATNYAHERDRLNSIYGIYKPVMKKVNVPVPPSKSGEKDWWYKVSPELKTKILKACEYHKVNEGIVYSPYALINLAIEEHCEELEELSEKVGTVY